MCRSLILPLALALSGCAAGTPDDAYTPRLPPLQSIVGSAPLQPDIPDDVKADGPLPAQYTDLVGQQSDVRQQGDRGVCTIFTSTALLEHLAIRSGTSAPDYSEQFLQWTHKAERPDPDHSEGSDLGQVMDTLASRGTVDEGLWPYEPLPWAPPVHPSCTGTESQEPVSCFTNGSPSAAALAAPRHKLPIGRFLRTSAIKNYLQTQQTPVALGVEVIDAAWSYPPTQYTARPGAWERGEVTSPNASETAAAKARGSVGHAVLIVGWDDDYTAQTIGDDGQPKTEKGFYIIKNSWGTTYWGKGSAHGAGFGMLSYAYVEQFGTAYVVGLPTGAPPPADGEHHDGQGGSFVGGTSSSDTITVDQAGPASSALVSLSISDPDPSSLTIRLAHDNGSWTLWDHNPTTQPIRGNWELEGLDRVDRSGPWVLTIESDAGAPGGDLASWSITFK